MAETAVQSTQPAAAPKEAPVLFGKKEKRVMFDPLWDNNPITRQVLGICSSLAVTVQIKTAIVMCIGLTFTTAMSNLLISLLRNYIPQKVRILVELAVIASLVIMIDQILKAYLFDISKQMSVFVGLIITNCIVLGRTEAYALGNPPWRSFLDGVGNGLGYSVVLLAVATFREIFGSGKWFGLRVIPESWYASGYSDMGLMVLAPGAFVLLGLFVWAQRELSKKYES